MKKIVLASLIALSSQLALAATTQDTINPEFAKIEEMVKANNMTGAYQALEKLAKSGNPQAMYNLAYLTQTGQGTAKNEKKAIQLYQDAANKGYPVAHYVLAKNYVTGTLGLPQDINKAKQHFEAASKLGFDDATVEYAVLLFSENKPESEKLALKKLEPLMKKESTPTKPPKQEPTKAQPNPESDRYAKARKISQAIDRAGENLHKLKAPY
jgi:TPR repeat protein